MATQKTLEVDYVTKGNDAFDKKDHQAAILFFKEAIKINPFNPDYYAWIGNAYTWLITGNFVDSNRSNAITFWEMAVKIDPTRLKQKSDAEDMEEKSWGHYGGYKKWKEKSCQEAKQHLSTLLNQIANPPSHDSINSSYSNLIYYYYNLEEYVNVIETFKQAVTWRKKVGFHSTILKKDNTIDISEVNLYKHYAEANYKVGNYQVAEIYFTELLQYFITNENKLNDYYSLMKTLAGDHELLSIIFRLFYTRGLMRQAAGHSEKAIDDFEKAIEIKDIVFKRNISLKYDSWLFEPTPHKGLAEEKTKIQAKQEIAKNLLIKAKKYYEAELYVECEELCRGALSSSQSEHETYLYLALTNFHLKQPNQATEYLKFYSDNGETKHLNEGIKTKITEIIKKAAKSKHAVKTLDKEKESHFRSLNKIFETIADDIIYLAINGTPKTPIDIKIPPFCTNGVMKSKTEQKIAKLINVLFEQLYKRPKNFSKADYGIMIAELAQSLQKFMQVKDKSHAKQKTPTIKFTIKDKDISKNENLRKDLSTTLTNAGKLIEKAIAARGNRLLRLVPYEDAINKLNEEIFSDFKQLNTLLAKTKKQSKSDYQQIIKQNPEDGVDYMTRGQAYMALDRPGEAILDFKKAINLNIKIHLVYFELANAYFKQGNYNEAIKNYKLAINIKDDEYMDYLKLSSSYFLLKNWQDAKTACEIAIKLMLHVEAAEQDAASLYLGYAGLADVHFELAEHAQTVNYCDQAINLDPHKPYAYFVRAKANYALGMLHKVLEDCRSAIKFARGDHPEATQLLEECETKLREERSRQQAEQVLQRQTEEKDKKQQVEKDKNETLKQALLELKQAQDAGETDVSALDDRYHSLQVLALELQNADYYVAHADFYVATAQTLNDKEQAIELYNRALIDYAIAIKIKPLYRGISEKKQTCTEKLTALTNPPKPALITNSNASFFPKVPLSREQLSPEMQAQLDQIKERMRKEREMAPSPVNPQ